MNVVEIWKAAVQHGLRLESRGDMLSVRPASRCPPAFAEVLRQHKPEILAFLESQTTKLCPEEIAWLHVARQILAGEFDKADRSTRESVASGLRSIRHPLCQRALARIKPGC